MGAGQGCVHAYLNTNTACTLTARGHPASQRGRRYRARAAASHDARALLIRLAFQLLLLFQQVLAVQRPSKYKPHKAETAFSSLQRSSAGLQKHGVAIGLLTAAVGAVWFASRVQAGNEKDILQVQPALCWQTIRRQQLPSAARSLPHAFATQLSFSAAS